MASKALGSILLLCVSCNEVIAWQTSSDRRMIAKASASSSPPAFGDGPYIQPSPRRQFLSQITQTVAIAAASTIMLPSQACNAAMTADSAREQWKQASKTLDDVLENWSTVEGVGGDPLRTILGQLDTTSPLFQIEKAFKELRESEYVDDFMEFTETEEDFMTALYRADSYADSANLKTGSGKQTPPAVSIGNAKTEVLGMQGLAKKLNAMVK